MMLKQKTCLITCIIFCFLTHALETQSPDAEEPEGSAAESQHADVDTDTIDLPDLEPEEPAEEWPSQLHHSENPADWPGNNQPVGETAPAISVDRLKAFPDRKVFIGDYLVPSLPLVVANPFAGTTIEKNWGRDSHYTTNAYAALKRVTVGAKEDISMREFFLRKSWDNTIQLDTSLPDFMRLEFPVPISLQCKPVIEELQEARLRNTLGKLSLTVPHSSVDRLTCTVRGSKNVTMISNTQVHRDSNFTEELNSDFFALNPSAVNYEKFPGLRFAKVAKVRTKATDCLYVPAKWMQIVQTSENYMEVEISWNHKFIESGEKACGDPSNPRMTLGLLKLQKEPDTDLHGLMSVAPLQSLLNGVGQKNFTLEQMESWLKRDKKILSKLTEWNDEYAEIAGELFLLLDLNRDAVFSASDLDFLTPEKQPLFLGRLQDRMHDLNDIMTDQQADKQPTAGAPAGLTPELKAHLEKYNQEMKKLIADAVAQKNQQAQEEPTRSAQDSTLDEPKRDRPKGQSSNTRRDEDVLEASSENDFVLSSGKFNEEEEIMAEDDDGPDSDVNEIPPGKPELTPAEEHGREKTEKDEL